MHIWDNKHFCRGCKIHQRSRSILTFELKRSCASGAKMEESQPFFYQEFQLHTYVKSSDDNLAGQVHKISLVSCVSFKASYIAQPDWLLWREREREMWWEGQQRYAKGRLTLTLEKKPRQPTSMKRRSINVYERRKRDEIWGSTKKFARRLN